MTDTAVQDLTRSRHGANDNLSAPSTGKTQRRMDGFQGPLGHMQRLKFK